MVEVLTFQKSNYKIKPNSSSPVIIGRRQGERTKRIYDSRKKAAGMTSTKWIEWVHIQTGKSHCDTCLKLDGCWFLDEKKPKLPQHFFCHCAVKPIDYNSVIKVATAKSDYSKFDPYLFNRDDRYEHNKQKLFESWGYKIEDAAWLKGVIEEQCLKKYVNGDYELGVLNKYGQRMSIRIEIPRKDKEGVVSFITGWTVYPNGHIQLNAPYGGK